MRRIGSWATPSQLHSPSQTTAIEESPLRVLKLTINHILMISDTAPNLYQDTQKIPPSKVNYFNNRGHLPQKAHCMKTPTCSSDTLELLNIFNLIG